MTESTVKQLPAETVKLITSTQIVTSVSTAVKELVENSIDAGAKVIQIRLENFGLNLIEVKDDGSGVSYDNVQRMFLPGYTSKIRQFEDLGDLYSYGFRGEALAAICKIGKVSITTKTNVDTLAMAYDIDSTGLPLSSKPSHLNIGTVIAVSGLFSNLPVRRQYLSSKKKMSEELKKTEQIVQSLSLIHPELSVSLIHDKNSIWKKNSVKGIKQSFMQVAGLKVVSKMEHLNKNLDKFSVDLVVPKKNLENVDNLVSNSFHSVYIFVNKRPIDCKVLSQPVQEHIFHHFRKLNISSKYATCLISVVMPPQQIDINLEPNKTKILIKNQMEVIKVLDEVLSNYYNNEDFICSALKDAMIDEIIDDQLEEQPSKRPRLDSGESVDEKRSKEFREKNREWRLEIINENCPVSDDTNAQNLLQNESNSNVPKSLCSQINSTNSVLTREEVLEVNTILSETNQKLVTTTNSKNSETRLIERNDIQSRNFEKPILPEWPTRPKTDIGPQSNFLLFEPSTEEKSNDMVEKSKDPKEIAAEIEKDVENWSGNMMKQINFEIKKEDLTYGEKLEEDVEQFDLSMQSVSSQMGKKEMKAFTKFARIMRPKIVQEFPNIMFTQVAGILAERWRSLTPEEVKYYEKMAEVVDVNRKTHKEEKQIEKLKPALIKENPANKKSKLKSMFERMKKQSKISRPPRKETLLDVTFSLIKEFKAKSDKESTENEFQLVGQLQPSGNWLYRKGKVIGHIRHQGLQELITSQKMLSSYSLTRVPLPVPVVLNEENLGSTLWNILITLETKFDEELRKYYVDSDVITKNGFAVEIEKNEDVVSSVLLTEVASCIPHYGISELKDALGMYEKNGECGGLATWRPTAVCNYITNEAIRLAQQSAKPPNSQEIEEMMNIYNLCLTHLEPVCLHMKEIFPKIYNPEEKLPDTLIT